MVALWNRADHCIFILWFLSIYLFSSSQRPHILGLQCRPPFTDEGQIWCATAGPRSTLTCQISSECVHSVGFRWPKNTILGKFRLLWNSCTDRLLPMRAKFSALEQTHGIRLLVLSPTGSRLRKMDTGAQLQTLPYPMVSKLFLYSNAFMAKSGAQGLTFKSVTNEQTDKQADRQNTQRFSHPGGGWNPTPSKLGTVIEDLEQVLAPLKF